MTGCEAGWPENPTLISAQRSYFVSGTSSLASRQAIYLISFNLAINFFFATLIRSIVVAIGYGRRCCVDCWKRSGGLSRSWRSTFSF